MADWIEATLRRDGHDVDAHHRRGERPRRTGRSGCRCPDHVWHRAPEYFRYLASVEAFERIDTRRYDAVVSTQPPSFATPHPRHLSLFFHHHRIFYDLEERYLAAGFSPDPELHRRAAARVRDLDRPLLDAVRWFLAGSEPVRPAWPAGTASTASACSRPGRPPRLAADDEAAAGARRSDGPGALRRPARVPEASRAVRAGACTCSAGATGVLVGDGGRMAWVRAVDERLGQSGADPAAVPAEELWCTHGVGRAAGGRAAAVAGRDRRPGRRRPPGPAATARRRASSPPPTRRTTGSPRSRRCATARRWSCAVTAAGWPASCATASTGWWSSRTRPSIAAAVERICSDDDLRGRLSRGAVATAATFTWRRAADQLRAGLATRLWDDAPGEDRHRRSQPGAVHPGRRRAGVGRAGTGRSTS